MNKDFDYEGVFFTMGPISIHQFAEFSKHGLGALRLFQYIKTKQGLNKYNKNPWVKVDNVNAYKWFGLTSPTKWRAIRKLEKAKLIEVERKYGRAVKVKLICPEKIIN